MFSFTISKKIALSLILVLSLSIAGMAWLTAKNLQTGFNNYLKEKQVQELNAVADVMAQHYRMQGSFASLRHNPRRVRMLLDQALGRNAGIGNADDTPPEPPDQSRSRPTPGDQEAMDVRGPRREQDRAFRQRERVGMPPPEQRRADLQPDARMDSLNPAKLAPQPEAEPLPPAPETALPPSREPRDPMEMGPRLSMTDAIGEPVFGPLRQAQNNLQADVMVNGKKVASLFAPIPQFALEKTTLWFVRSQLKNIFWLATALILLATLVSIWLSKHLVKPIAGLRRMTQQIASGQFHSRVEVLNQDELGGLAQQINLMAKSLESNEKKRRQVMADLSHELRTPLTVMRAEVEAVLDGIRPLNEETVRSLAAEIMHLNKLVDDLHQLALADAGDLRFQFSNIELVALVNHIAERFQARLQKANLRLQLLLPKQELYLRADPGRITQVIENILENSLRYTDPNGVVQIQVIKETGFVRIELEDSAPCLSDGNYDKMFDRLYREDKARSRAKGGSGLGLSICRTLVRAHHGEIQASPSTLGGVKISIVLPL